LFPGDPARRIKRFDRFEAAIAQLRQPVQMLTLANVPRPRVPLILNAADCVVLTSDSEGSPVVVREALACNTPIVSVDVGDVRQQLAGVAPGEVAGPSPANLAAAIERVLVAGARSNGRASVSGLGLDAIAARVYQVYERAIAGRHPRRQTSVQVRT
jgi:glycosyltransferase involved in cell wall biosynthesis